MGWEDVLEMRRVDLISWGLSWRTGCGRYGKGIKTLFYSLSRHISLVFSHSKSKLKASSQITLFQNLPPCTKNQTIALELNKYPTSSDKHHANFLKGNLPPDK